MSAKKPLQGIDLVDCAKANAPQGIEMAADQCGYGSDLDTFFAALQQAGEEMGVDIESIQDLITDRKRSQALGGIEISPDTSSQL